MKNIEEIDTAKNEEKKEPLFRFVIGYFLGLAVFALLFVGTCLPFGFLLFEMGGFIYIVGLVLYIVVFALFLYTQFKQTKSIGRKAAILTLGAIALLYILLFVFGGELGRYF